MNYETITTDNMCNIKASYKFQINPSQNTASNYNIGTCFKKKLMTRFTSTVNEPILTVLRYMGTADLSIIHDFFFFFSKN